MECGEELEMCEASVGVWEGRRGIGESEGGECCAERFCGWAIDWLGGSREGIGDGVGWESFVVVWRVAIAIYIGSSSSSDRYRGDILLLLVRRGPVTIQLLPLQGILEL